jgi:hypothetical protein
MREHFTSSPFYNGILFEPDSAKLRSIILILMEKFASYLSSKNLTNWEERAVKTPNPNIPTLKLKRSATNPRTNGPPPIPKITPMAMMNPMAIDLSETEVNFEIAIKATGKKARENRACKMRVTKTDKRVEERARPIVLRPVAKMVHLSITWNPKRSVIKPMIKGTITPAAREIPSRVLAKPKAIPLSLIK